MWSNKIVKCSILKWSTFFGSHSFQKYVQLLPQFCNKNIDEINGIINVDNVRKHDIFTYGNENKLIEKLNITVKRQWINLFVVNNKSATFYYFNIWLALDFSISNRFSVLVS